MASYCFFWRITPAEFWDLDMAEYKAMGRFMRKYQEEQQSAINHAKARGRR